MITNMGPLGCYPANLANVAHGPADVDANGCLTSFNAVVSGFNDLLRNRSFLLQTQLYGASVIYVDVYSIKYQLWANGAVNGRSASLGRAWPKTPSIQQIYEERP
jgi:hypothetical protein